jgi:molybdenum cofactor cytidylyltransferase
LLPIDLLPIAYKVQVMSVNSLYAVVLAAGEASRFGSTKQLAKFAGEPLAARAIRTVESVCGSRSLLVTGNDWRKVSATCEPLQGFMILNPRFEEGLASSLAQGVRSVCGVADGVLLMLADQPLITTEHLESLARTWDSSPESICASSYAGTIGPPVIFPSRYFPDLMELRGDRGAKTVIDMNRDQVVTIQFEDAAVDIDCPDDLDRR